MSAQKLYSDVVRSGSSDESVEGSAPRPGGLVDWLYAYQNYSEEIMH
jgi:hypothetical protein